MSSPSGDAKKERALTREFTILNKYGIHARPAALFIKTVNRFKSEVTVERDGLMAPANSIMALLTLEGYQGTKLKVTAVGPDAEEVLDAIGELIEKKFYEE